MSIYKLQSTNPDLELGQTDPSSSLRGYFQINGSKKSAKTSQFFKPTRTHGRRQTFGARAQTRRRILNRENDDERSNSEQGCRSATKRWIFPLRIGGFFRKPGNSAQKSPNPAESVDGAARTRGGAGWATEDKPIDANDKAVARRLSEQLSVGIFGTTTRDLIAGARLARPAITSPSEPSCAPASHPPPLRVGSTSLPNFTAAIFAPVTTRGHSPVRMRVFSRTRVLPF